MAVIHLTYRLDFSEEENMMLNLLRKRRSIRKFEDKKLEPW